MKNDKPTILYVEDDSYLSFVTKDNLELKGYSIVLCKDGQEALERFAKESFDLCILDVMLPSLNGFELAKKIREQNEHIPILFLSAKSMKEDRIEGLTIGGDDYLTKPFSIEELALKIDIFLRRGKVLTASKEKGEYVFGSFVFHSDRMELIHPNESRRLTSREAALLNLFLEKTNVVITKEEILKAVWGTDSYFNSRSLDVFISRLRKYLRNDPAIQINNIHGIGFIMVVK